MDKPVIICSTY